LTFWHHGPVLLICGASCGKSEVPEYPDSKVPFGVLCDVDLQQGATGCWAAQGDIIVQMR
jgi:hypothetical protein